MSAPQEMNEVRPQLTPAERDLLITKAKSALHNAYAPYSKFMVGAAVLTEAGNVYTGCNVENSSYGLTNCAERSAIFAAVSAEGSGMHIRAIAVWSNPEGPCSPCGACRQVMFEFGPKAIVLFQGLHGLEEVLASELLPYGFLFEATC